MSSNCPIKDLKTIMLSTDGSEFSEAAVGEALILSSNCASRLLAIFVVEANEEYASEAPKLVEKAEVEAGKILDSVKSRASEAGIDCETAVHTGDSVFRIIVDEAKRNGVELIVMGRRGRSGLAKLAMGSVTARVIGHAPCDVLVVPRGCAVDYRSIMVAIDGSEHAEVAATEAIRLTGMVDGTLTILSVARSEESIASAEENVAKISKMADAAGIKSTTMTGVGKPYVEIVETANRIKADLIVVGRHGHGLSKLLMGNVTERVIGHASCSVMAAYSE